MFRPSVAEAVSLKSLRCFLTKAARISLPLLALATVTPTARAAFDITLNFTANTTAEQQQYFIDAANYWESQISGYKAGVTLNGITISADVKAIDGVGGTLGSAGPSSSTTQAGTRYTTTGNMQFDSADVDRMIANGTFGDVIRHEMGHVLGIGTQWSSNNLKNANGQYSGANALAAWKSEFSQPGATEVPVEQGGSGGTAGSHWNENEVLNPNGSYSTNPTGFVSKYNVGRDFEYELMTGWANSPAFTSSVTLGSLMDMGYALRIPTDANGDYLLSAGRVFTGLDDTGGARSMRKITTDGVALAAAGNFTGGSSIEAGTLYIEHINALGTGAVTVAGGTLDVGATGVAGIGVLTLQSGVITGTTGVITASGYAVQSGSVAAILAGTGTLTKSTTGTVELSGANTYTGATQVDAGTLIVSGSLGNTAVTVASGAIFGGKATVGSAGGASVKFNAGSIFLGDTTGAMTVDGTVNVDVGARIDMNGTLGIGQKYIVLISTGTATGLGNFITLFRGTVDTSVTNQVAVTAQAAVPLTWSGATDGNWGVVDSKNNFKRTTGGLADNFYQGDSVAFTDAATQKTISINGRLQTGGITVSNTTGTYTFGGPGEIAGTGGLTKTGAGTLIINTNNTFTGKTALNGGVTQIASESALGSAPDSFVADQLSFDGGTLKAGANLTLANNRGITVGAGGGEVNTNGFAVTAGGKFGGAGDFTKSGAGTLELTGASSNSGNILVTAGTLKLSNLSGSGLTSMDVGSAGTLLINDSTGASINRNITVHGNGAGAATGLQIAEGENFQLQGTLTLADAATTIRASGSGTATLSTYAPSGFSNPSSIVVLSSASGSVIDSSILFGGPKNGVSNNFGQTINVTAGANTATGDLRIDGVLQEGAISSPIPTFQTRGTGSVNITSVSPEFSQSTFDIRNTSTVMFTGSASLGGGTNSGTISVNTSAKFIWASSATQTLSGVISGNGSLTRSGSSGTLTLTGANTYTGGTTVTGGKLLVNNTTGSGLGATGVVNVSGLGTVLGGSGSYTAGLTTIGSGARLQGGDGTTGTTLSIGSGVTLASGSIIQLALGSSLSHSTLARTGGTWNFDGNQKISFLDLGGVTTGTYSNLITGLAVDPGTTSQWTFTNPSWAGHFTYNNGNIGFVLTAIPEPATYGLLGAGSLALVALVRRRRRRRATPGS